MKAFALLLLLSSTIFPCFAENSILEAEQLIKNGAPLDSVAQFRGHPLYPYLQYRSYRTHLNSVPVNEVVSFIKGYPNAPYTNWLAEYAFPIWLNNKNYSAIITAYNPNMADDEGIECTYRLAQLALGNTRTAYNNINALWLKDHSIDSACTPLFEHAIAEHHIGVAALRQRFIMTMLSGKTNIARHISGLLPASDAAAAQIWLSALGSSSPYAQAQTIQDAYWQQNALTDLLRRQATKKPGQTADTALHQLQTNLADPDLTAALFNRLTRALAKNDDARLLETWARIPHGKHADDTILDLIAYCLRRHDWQTLANTLHNSLNPQESKPEIHYWLGKAYEKLGRHSESRHEYQQAAKKRDFFGFLAAEKLGLPYAFNDHSVNNNLHLQTVLLSQPETYRLRTFHHMGLDNRALSEWKSLISHRSNEETRQAALIAQRLGWHFQAILALADNEDWDALNIRFPLLYRQRIGALAAQHHLDPASIYAIIRKESIFQPDIRSPAGAVGLMQIMPATARDTANRYAIAYQGSSQLSDPDTNLAIGSQYLADRLQEFGHLAYAAAAYNAGPQRVRSWLTANPSLPLDEWIALIPFNETRDYVKRVLEYEKVYQYRLHLPYTPYATPTIHAW